MGRKMSNDTQKIEETSEADQRYLPRWEIRNRVLYSLDSDQYPKEGRTKDLSGTGVCILTRENIIPHQKIQLTIYLSEGTMVKVQGNVVWVRPSTIENQLGINFREISDDAQELILQHAFEINKSEVLKHWFNGWDAK